jgi:putative flavoprotein involved in K+ transport
MPQTNILIIGGGAAGLSAAGALKQYDLDAVILDKDATTGDVWRQRYDRLHLHTIKGLSHSAYKKLPAEFPRYIPKDKFADYMANYAKAFNLDIHHNTVVSRISKGANGYVVETQGGETWEAPIVIVATGVNRVPFIPKWEGLEQYKGQFSHAASYKSGRDYKGKHVLVVGVGNTGAEICVDLLEQGAAYVANSIRTFPPIVLRDPLGIPIQFLGVLMLPLPAFIKDPLANTITRLLVGDLSKYGIKAPEWGVYKDQKVPMIDVGYIAQLKQGNIKIKADIRCFDEKGVQFIDGSREDFDAVIAATGYRTGLEKILDIPNLVDESGKLLVESGKATGHKGLWFVGFDDTPAGVLLRARIHSRGIAKQIAAEQGVKV